MAIPNNPPIHRILTCASTNSVALELAKQGAAHGTTVVTEAQTNGRGRQGRSWIAAENSLAFSMILRPNISIKLAPRLSFTAAVALQEALQQFQIEAFIKWPNDIVILSADKKNIPIFGPFRKIAGILVEVSSMGSQIETAVIGIGVNVARGNKRELENLPQAGFLSEAGFTGEKDLLLSAMLGFIQAHFEKIGSQVHWSQCLEKIRRYSATLNRIVIINEGQSTITGKAIAILDDGSLVIQKADGQEQAIYAGDVWI